MSYPYIAQALTYISTRRGGPKTCDLIGKALSARGESGLTSLNRSLNFVSFFRRSNSQLGISYEDLKAARRAAILLTEVFPSTQQQKTAAKSWDYNDLESSIGAFLRQLPPMDGLGYYLKGSFWAFSTAHERAWTRESWADALRMLEAALECLTEAIWDEEAERVFRRWFGSTDRLQLREKVLSIRGKMTSKLIGFSYLGPNVDSSSNYHEESATNSASKLAAHAGSQEWAFASPASCTHNTIGVLGRFFQSDKTAIQPEKSHDTDSGDMGVTRGGAIVHELSHRYARTVDQPVPATVYAHLNKAVPADNSKKRCYGPIACAALAHTNPEMALLNADSYRLFCEDAFVFMTTLKAKETASSPG